VLQAGGLTVELVKHDDAVARGQTDAAHLHGFFKAGFVVEDFECTIAELRRRGAEFAFGPFPKQPTQPANAAIKDNAGNLIQIFGR